MKTLHGFAATAIALVCLSAVAQSLTPGLWEMTLKMQNTESGESAAQRAEREKKMAAMPAAQRKELEQLLGISSKDGSTFKTCVSKDDAQEQRAQMDKSGCKRQVLQQSGNTVKFKWQCTDPNPSSGEGSYTLADKTFSAKEVSTSIVDGKPERTSVERSGRWLSADCGAIGQTAPTKR